MVNRGGRLRQILEAAVLPTQSGRGRPRLSVLPEKLVESWREVWGVEQTEIAALAALRPNDLRRIAFETIAPLYDETVAQRTATAREEWREMAADMLAEHPDCQAALDAIAAAREDALAAVDALHNAQRQAIYQLDSWEPPKFQVPIAEILQAPPPPLFSTEDDFTTASLRLKDRKALLREGGGQ